MHQGICKLTMIPVRAEPNGKSELVTQVFFGETYSCNSQEGEWIKIETTADNYHGWINQSQFCSYTGMGESRQVLKKFPMVEAIHQTNGSSTYLLPGSILHKFEPTDTGAFFYINNDKFFARVTSKDLEHINSSNLESYMMQFLNSPYLWGGSSMWGIDCSGFTQLIYKTMGFQLPRDAWQQSEKGEIVTFVNEAKLGDLAFFENDNGGITHVGIMVRPGEILHSSGKVRLDVLDSYGIYHSTLCKHTHKLRFIKRILK